MTTAVQPRLVGSWELGERIGGGGQASVHRARHAILARPAALKLVHPAVWADPAFRVRFHRECDALVALDHPHVVPILDAGEHAGQGYLVMALARDGSLADRLAAGPIAPDEAGSIVSAVASALDAAHAAGVLHRDVTPSNVLLDPAGPWLADFGLALRGEATALTEVGTVIGTAGYLAPEVIAGGRATEASDRYALAVTAFRALTGEPPLRADGVAGLLYAHAHREPRRASDVRPGLPPALDRALAAGLAKDPAARPRSALELADAITAAVGSPATPTRALARRPAPPATPRRRRGRRRAALLATVALAGVAGAGAAAAALTLGGGDPAPAAPAAPNPRVALPETVPGPDGIGVRAEPARASDMPGGVAVPGAVSAEVGDVLVTAAPGGWTALSPVAARLEDEGYVLEPLAPDGRLVGYEARRYTILDVLGQSERWALVALAESTGERAVLVGGVYEEPAEYAATLARARAGQVVPPG